MVMKSQEVIDRVKTALKNSLGQTIAEALNDVSTEEIRANPDGKIWVVHQKKGLYDTGEVITSIMADSVIRLMADAADIVVTDKTPLVSGEIPGSGERFQGVYPPVSTAPFFVIRKPATTIYSLDDYVEMGAATKEKIATIRNLISGQKPKNIVVIGGTFTGKTTFGNALLAEPAYKKDRCLILEDRRELNFSGLDVVKLLANEEMTMAQLLKVSLRLSPKRIILGEVRDGAAWQMVQSWNTGHDGGFGTFHANDPESALYRLEDMIGEVTATIPRNSIITAIGAMIHIRFDGAKRVVGDILTLKGYNYDERKYITEVIG